MRARPSVLPSGMRLVGDVRGEDDFVVLGTIEGQLQVEGTVVVEEGATVQGNIRGRSVAIRGSLVGDAVASDSIRVDAGGRVVGDLHAPRVNLVRGALFRGHVHMTETATAVPMRRTRTRSRAAALQGRRSSGPSRPSEAVRANDGASAMQAAPPPDTLVESSAPTMVERPSSVDEEPRRPPKPIFPAVGRTRARRVSRDRP